MKPIVRHAALFLLGVSAFALAAIAGAQAPAYPTKPIRLVVPFPAGGATDILAREVAKHLTDTWGQSVVVDNRPGAGGNIGSELVAKAPPDGYTLEMGTVGTHAINASLYSKMPYDHVKDFVPVILVSGVPNVLEVNPAVPVNSVQELIAYAKANPGKLNFASSGNGSAPHLAAVLFNRVAGVEMVHVPFKSGGLAVQSVLAGDTQVTFSTPPSVLPQVQAGRLRGLALTSRSRSPLVPGLPGMEEAGLPDYEISFWYGFFVPAGTPPEIVKKLFEATTAALAQPEVGRMFAREGTETAASRSADEFAAFLAEDAKLWARLVRESGAKID